jgi:hypothetical protein
MEWRAQTVTQRDSLNCNQSQFRMAGWLQAGIGGRWHTGPWATTVDDLSRHPVVVLCYRSVTICSRWSDTVTTEHAVYRSVANISPQMYEPYYSRWKYHGFTELCSIIQSDQKVSVHLMIIIQKQVHIDFLIILYKHMERVGEHPPLPSTHFVWQIRSWLYTQGQNRCSVGKRWERIKLMR